MNHSLQSKVAAIAAQSRDIRQLGCEFDSDGFITGVLMDGFDSVI